MKITPKQAVDFISRCIAAKLAVMLSGSPGIGKSDIVKQIADKYSLELIDIRMSTLDPVDMSGIPMITGELASWIPMDVFPLENRTLPPGKHGWLIFLDEFNSASMAVQAAAYRLVLDREIGQHKLHPNVAIVCAGNLTTDGAIVNRMSTAMQSRQAHLELSVSITDWLLWARVNGIDHRLMAYLTHKPDNLQKFDPNHNDKTFACPRTHEFCSRLIKGIPTSGLQELRPLLAGTISEGVAAEFIAHTEIYSKIPTYQDIIADPLGSRIGNDPSMLFGVAYMIGAHAQKKDISKVMEYISRLPTEYTTICLQDICQKDPSVRYETEVNRWLVQKGADAFA